MMTGPAISAADARTRTALRPDESFIAHRARVYRWAGAHGLNHDGCLDVVQETFARLLRSAPAFVNEAAQLAWLRRVAVNLAVDSARARRGHAGLRLVHHPDSGPALGEEARAALREAMTGLSEMQRLVLVMKTVDAASFAEIARELEIGIPTAKTHYLRALEAIRRRWPEGVAP